MQHENVQFCEFLRQSIDDTVIVIEPGAVPNNFYDGRQVENKNHWPAFVIVAGTIPIAEWEPIID